MTETIAGDPTPLIAEGVLITFDRVGRNRNVQPLQVMSLHEEVIRERVYRYIKGMLKSTEASVYVNLDIMLVELVVGAGVGVGEGAMEYIPVGSVPPQE